MAETMTDYEKAREEAVTAAFQGIVPDHVIDDNPTFSGPDVRRMLRRAYSVGYVRGMNCAADIAMGAIDELNAAASSIPQVGVQA